MDPWAKTFDKTLADDEARPEPATVERFAKVYGSCPAAMYQRIWHCLWEDKPIETSPVSDGTTELFVSCALAMADHLAATGEMVPEGQTVDEVTLSFLNRVMGLVPDVRDRAFERIRDFDADLYGLVFAHAKGKGIQAPPVRGGPSGVVFLKAKPEAKPETELAPFVEPEVMQTTTADYSAEATRKASGTKAAKAARKAATGGGKKQGKKPARKKAAKA